MGAAAGNPTIGYCDTDLVRSLTQNGTATTFDLDTLGRRATATSVSASGTSTLVRHYADPTDNPAWAVATGTDGVAHTTWYGTSLGGDLGLTITDDVVSVQLADIHGDTALPITLDTNGDIAAIGGYSDFDEYGRPLAGTSTPDTGAVTYGWLGGNERATDEATGLLLMGVRLYNPNTGLFTSVDPIVGGNTTAYAYPQDPINKYDLDGKAWGWLSKAAKAMKVIAKVADIASFIPGPVGMIAAGVATAALLATGDYKGAAAAAIGLLPGGKLLSTAAKIASKAGKAGKEFKSSAKLGQAVHRQFAAKHGGEMVFKSNTTGRIIGRADGHTKAGGPIELKPYNSRAISQGMRQLARYEQLAGKRGELWTYRKTWYGRIKYSKYSG